MRIDEIGKSIALRRKQLGLSQEELAGQLGVTRQAVSKWESGAALPSVDNMVELARLFDVSVDELLQLNHAAHDSGLSAEGVGLLLDEQSLRQEKRMRRQNALLIAVAAALLLPIVLSIALSVLLSVRTETRVNERIQQTQVTLESRIIAMDADVSGAVRQALDEGVSRLTDGGCRSHAYDPASDSVLLALFAYPQRLEEGCAGEFYALLRDGSRVSVPAETVQGGFEGTLSIPAPQEEFLSPKVYVSWQEDGGTVTEALFVPTLRLDDMRARIVDLWANLSYSVDTGSELTPYITLSVPTDPGAALPVSVLFEVFSGGGLLASAETLREKSDSAPAPDEAVLEVWETLRLPEEMLIGPGHAPETLLLRATVTDSAGSLLKAEFSFG